ncbi:flavin-containing monooxygenase [Aspergillus brunneoviolaceus CBS 621.78]|uniref:FAD/NAD(P)-binding domain-containing protein n=1 Tax=Aspergillus brunneoviolaceus CBS 621.78 TaxID=1450534 RepID=A0ACD1FZT5_9EURO|nr:FAD/NAD(P)-binding domain-containing protein [Aspergillus brunneoviolaceus CBS 621.78]RAH42489.1 FAD/NAD(P)-binding domain-containing protein [Aspergillus brunneoviolaceus CBS 621.78]
MAIPDLVIPGAEQLAINGGTLDKAADIELQYGYIDTFRSDKFRHFSTDPWASSCDTVPLPITHDFRTKVLIVGAGYVSLLFAGRLIEQGFKPEDLIFVDSAAGFGGVWYWNRYPGLMCDVESYIYLPLIEKTGFVPKHKYSYGQELRYYANLLAKTPGVDGRGVFRSTVTEAVRDQGNAQWDCQLRTHTGEQVTVRADLFILASGVLSRPRVPRIPGIEHFKGHSMSIQIVPELAKWVQELVVFQRTPAATDPVEFQKQVATYSGWQKDRMINFVLFFSNLPRKSEINLVDDAWTILPSFSGVVGGPHAQSITPDNLAQYVDIIQKLDMVRQDRVREIVHDAEIAKALHPWCSGFCKRPCFHDDYLGAFNRPNFKIVHTNAKGVEEFTERGIVSDGVEHELDLIIFRTGFEPFTVGSPAYRAGIRIKGRGGLDMDDKWAEGVSTFHGILSRGSPNLILTGYTQAGATVNQVHQMGVQAEHAAHIISEALKRAAADGKNRVVVEPTESAEEEWAMRVVSQAHAMAILLNCTPSYTTAESALRADLPPEVQLKAAQGAT